MKVTGFLLLLILLFNIREGRGLTPVNPNATPEAVSLLDFIQSIRGKNILSGQHNYLHRLSIYTDEAVELTEKTPAVWGSDFSFSEETIPLREKLVETAIEQHRKGAIVTLMWHAVRPTDEEPCGWKSSVQAELSSAEWDSLITPGTDLHQRWEAQVDVIAGYLKQLQEAHVPILWRPYHEMNGVWFWWGDKKGDRGFKELWIMLYHRLTDVHQINNLIWVWNANAPRIRENDDAYDYDLYFPGLDYVDVLAADVYHNDYKQSHHDDLLKLAQGKPIALGEVGQMPTPEILREQPQWTWFMVWSGFLKRNNSPENVHAVYHDPRTVSLEELKVIYPKGDQ